MICRLDPEKAFTDIEAIEGPILPPGGVEGAVVVRTRKGSRVAVGIGRVGAAYRLSRKEGQFAAVTKTRELSAEEYRDIMEAIAKPEIKQVGAVFERDALGGETYLVRYVAESGKIGVFLGNPRACGVQALAEAADTLDSVIDLGR